MAENKTQATSASVKDFIDLLPESRREDSYRLMEVFSELTQEKPVLWGTSIIGFGSQQLTYASGRTLNWFKAGFSPRKQNFALYLAGSNERRKALLQKLGKYKLGKSCIYIKKISDIDEEVLNELLLDSLSIKNNQFC
ncbi:MAG: DUF1801 domain-containing protein [Flavobacteriaceae bacterium]|nr:DUF1801 domain-containing protein [Flavobacteriaceae bacterium]